MQGATTVTLASALIAAVRLLGFDVAEPATTVLSETLAPWTWSAESGERPPCDWANATTRVESPLCNNFAIARAPAEALQTASERALRCAADGDVGCIFASEVGLAIPGVFVPDGRVGLRLLIAPRVLAARGAPRHVQLRDPRTGRPGRAAHAHEQLVVEALVGGVRNLQVLELAGADAYCVQFMWVATSDACAAELA